MQGSSRSVSRHQNLEIDGANNHFNFKYISEDKIVCKVSLRNQGSKQLLFKVRTNFPQYYQVIPTLGLLSQKATVSIYIDMLVYKCIKYKNTQQNLLDRLNDRFQVQYIAINEVDPQVESLKKLWEQMKSSSTINETIYKLTVQKPSQGEDNSQQGSFLTAYKNEKSQVIYSRLQQHRFNTKSLFTSQVSDIRNMPPSEQKHNNVQTKSFDLNLQEDLFATTHSVKQRHEEMFEELKQKVSKSTQLRNKLAKQKNKNQVQLNKQRFKYQGVTLGGEAEENTNSTPVSRLILYSLLCFLLGVLLRQYLKQ